MSKFSEKCKELLVENGSNVYRISKSASLERTTLQRMVTGRRIPNIDFLKTFCKALRLSLSEEQELMRLYKMEVIGEATYKSQESILHLFQHLAELEKSNMQLSRNVIQNGDLVLVSPLAKHPYDTDLLVHYIFQNVLHSEKDSFIYTNLPSESPLLLQYLSHFISKSSGKVLVKQLVFFHSNVADIYVNLEILSQILPLCFLENISYEPCYYYRKFINTDQEYSLYPYYIITPDHVLQLSSDLKRSILHSEQQLVQHYQEEFEHIMLHSSPFIYKPDSMEAAMEKYFGSTPPREIFTLESSLCDSDLFSTDMLQQLAQKYFSSASSIPQNYTDMVAQLLRSSQRSSFFTRQGAEVFCKTGMGSGTSGFLFSPLDPAFRVKALQHFLSTYSHSEKTMLNDDFIFPQTLYVELRDNYILYFILMNQNQQLSFISITENSICNAFYEFFQLLRKSEYVCPPEEITTLITEFLNKL